MMDQDFDSDLEKEPAPGVPATELDMGTLVGIDSELAESGLGPAARPLAAKTDLGIVARRFFRHKAARAGLIVLVFIIVLASPRSDSGRSRGGGSTITRTSNRR